MFSANDENLEEPLNRTITATKETINTAQDAYTNIIESVKSLLNNFEQDIGENPANCWLLGPSFSAADVYFGVFLHHLFRLNLNSMLENKPNVVGFWTRFRARRSVQEVLFPLQLSQADIGFAVDEAGSVAYHEDHFDSPGKHYFLK